MNTRSLERRARALSGKLQPRPRLIHCTGAKEELLAMLEDQIEREGGDIHAPVTWSAEQLELIGRMDAYLEQSIAEIEACYNVRFVP